MKKLLLLVIMLFAFSSVSAGTITSIQKTETADIGMDLNSIQVVRYNPPFYIIQVTEGQKNYATGKLGAANVQYFYDYKNQTIKTKWLNSYTSDNGTTFTKDEYTDTSLREVKPQTVAYFMANYAFFKAYGMFFSKDLQDRYGTTDPLTK